MHRPGHNTPRRTGDWQKPNLGPGPGKGGAAAAEGGSSTPKPLEAALTGKEIAAHMPTVPQWTQHGLEIRRRFHFDDFVGSMAFVHSVAELAEAAHHHPDILIQWNKVSLTLTTHSEKGLTGKDFDLAKKIDGLVSA